MNEKPTPAEIVIMASGAVALIFSFFDFYSFDAPFGGSDGVSAWDGALFPLATYMAIIGVIMGAVIALERFANVKPPDRVFTFTWPQVHLALAVFAFLVGLGFLIVDSAGDKAVGFWLMFIASIGLVVGAVLLMRERTGAASAGGSTGPPTS